MMAANDNLTPFQALAQEMVFAQLDAPRICTRLDRAARTALVITPEDIEAVIQLQQFQQQTGGDHL